MNPQAEIHSLHGGVVRASDWTSSFPFHRRPIPEGFRLYRRAEWAAIPDQYRDAVEKVLRKHPKTRLMIAPTGEPHPSAILAWDGHRN